jgi:hypothetical protein
MVLIYNVSYTFSWDLYFAGVEPGSSLDFLGVPGAGELFVYRFNFWATWPALLDFSIRFDTVGLFMGLTVLSI